MTGLYDLHQQPNAKVGRGHFHRVRWIAFTHVHIPLSCFTCREKDSYEAYYPRTTNSMVTCLAVRSPRLMINPILTFRRDVTETQLMCSHGSPCFPKYKLRMVSPSTSLARHRDGERGLVLVLIITICLFVHWRAATILRGRKKKKGVPTLPAYQIGQIRSVK